MLQEVLLSLAGHRSPLWDQVKDEDGSEDPGSLRSYLAPSERALLAPLANLSDLHIKLRDHTATISSSHPSIVCRAVAAAISSQNLTKFRQKILEVEASILTKDAGYVGGYGIVPLSTVVGEFAPWTRRLEWLWEVAIFMLPVGKDGVPLKSKSTGAATINFLESETYTGYSDLEEMATILLEIAERAWARQVATWVLYGKLPSHGAEDFFIRPGELDPIVGHRTHELRQELVPNFVSSTTAASLLSIGESLNQIRSQSSALATGTTTDPVMGLLPSSLGLLNTLTYPLSSSAFANIVASIRRSISQNALSQLLPLSKVLETLEIIQNFLLLTRGEFAISLIANADARISARHHSLKSIRKAGRLDDMTVKDAEAATILRQTFGELTSLCGDEDEDDNYYLLDTARTLLRLVVSHHSTTTIFSSSLLPTPTTLTFTLPASSPLQLFLSAGDIENYGVINSYLLSLRRAELHLSNLWKLTPLRRCHPSPRSADASTRRSRERRRDAQIRKHWASANKALFVLNELGAYFQGEVIQGHWRHLRSWIDRGTPKPGSAASSRPGTSSSTKTMRSNKSATTNTPTDDPVAIAQAHKLYLRALSDALLLGNPGFVKALRDILMVVDHFVALFERLLGAWVGLDLQEDDGVVDAFGDYVKEEREVLEEMGRSREALEEGLQGLVARVRGMEMEREREDVRISVEEMGLGLGGGYVPWRGRTIDRLMMKLDVLEGGTERGDTDGKEGNTDE